MKLRVDLKRIQRITPAQAGKSQGDRADRGAEQDHPRTGGEKKCDQQQSRAGQGSPPHRRGKECVDAASEVDRGITPAQAGKRSGRFPAGPRRWDHPRMGGEKRPAFSMMDSVSGSPPRGRGKGFCHHCVILVDGITPAQAGKRSCCNWGCIRSEDHPRVGGEKPFLFYGGSSDSGSPPRRRGKVFLTDLVRVVVGITPA